MRFVWDSAKNVSNQKKHGISFEEASTLFKPKTDYYEIYDEANSIDEDRFIAIGPIERGIVLVVHTEVRDTLIRIISARFATEAETQLFHSHMRGEL